jgi:hypothetical protein
VTRAPDPLGPAVTLTLDRGGQLTVEAAFPKDAKGPAVAKDVSCQIVAAELVRVVPGPDKVPVRQELFRIRLSTP